MISPEVIADARKTLGRQLAAHREAAGLIQERLAVLINYGRSTVASAETGYSISSRSFWERCDSVLDADGALLRGYDKFKALQRQQRTERSDLQEREGARSGHAESAQRESPRWRIPVPTASLADGGPDEPWSRLAYVLRRPDLLDEPTVEYLEWYTAEMFRREEHMSSRDFSAHLAAHVERLDRLLVGSPAAFERRLLTTAGEALALAGWLAWDRDDFAEAERLYDRAYVAGRQAGDGPLIACVMAYRSYGAEADGDLSDARELLVAAQRYVRSQGSAATRTWLAAREAEVNGALSDESAALRALDRAVTAYDYARPYRERTWTAFLTPSRLGGMSIATHLRLTHPDLDAVCDSVVDSLQATDFRKAIVLTEVAMAAVQRRDYDRAAVHGHDALDQAEVRSTRLIGQRLSGLHGMLRGKRSVSKLAELDDRLLAQISGWES
jgi:hypothetical protein